MDEVYTCVCKCQSFEIHDGFIKCSYCSKRYQMEGQVLQNVADFNERVEQVRKDIADNSKTEGG